jgi:hypothetical protein
MLALMDMTGTSIKTLFAHMTHRPFHLCMHVLSWATHTHTRTCKKLKLDFPITLTNTIELYKHRSQAGQILFMHAIHACVVFVHLSCEHCPDGVRLICRKTE